MDPKRNDPPKKPDGDDKKPKNLWATIFISIAILLAVISIFNFVDKSKYTQTTYSDFLNEMEKGREYEILVMRYGLNGDTPLTQREIAKKLRISRSYVSRIEKKGIDYLKNRFNIIENDFRE